MARPLASTRDRSERKALRRAAEEFVATGLFDPEWYAAQTGHAHAGPVAAAEDYLAGGLARHSPHPLVDLMSLPRHVRAALAAGDVSVLTARLKDPPGHRPFGPLFDARRFEHDPEARTAHPGGALGLWLATHGDDDPLPGGRGLTLAAARSALLAHVREVRREVRPAEVDWDVVTADLPRRTPGRVSIVLVASPDGQATGRAVMSALRHSGDSDVEVVIVDDGAEPVVGRHLVALLLDEPRVHVQRLTHGSGPARNVGLTHSTGAVVVFLDDHTEVRPGWLPPLLEALGDDAVLGAQPLLLRSDDTIASAGLAFPVDRTLPCPFLAGHPPEDAVRLGQQEVVAASGACLAMRATDLTALHGFDPAFAGELATVDLCLRAAARQPGSFVVVPASVVTHAAGDPAARGDRDDPAARDDRATFMERWRGLLPAAEPQRWAAAGFRVAHVYGDDQSIPSPRPVIVRDRNDEALRWGIKLPSVPGEKGDRWGDTHFAASLAAALEKLGQQVVTYRHGAHATPASAYDDVVLGIRGLDVIAPVPGKVNLLWVISHPDDVDPAELAGFDRVFAASAPWAAAMSERAGRPVEVLLQATDLRRQADLSRPVGDGSVPVFVGGTTPERDRAVVLDAVRMGLPVQVHGPNWTRKIPRANLASTYVPNDELADLYRAHGLVLADHHGDMAAHGFLANRLFDAVAAGARVISDPVPGLELFEGAVQAYSTPEELALLCGAAERKRFPDDEAMEGIRARVAAEHSFDHRAAELLAAARAELPRG